MISYKAVIAYDGSSFFGWQKTRMGPSIQETLENRITEITGELCCCEAASRTDRGVHAEGQVIAFSLQRNDLEERKLKQAMNALLPPEIRILSLERQERPFHPTLDAKGKEYHYRVCFGSIQDPMHRLYSWHFRYTLDIEKMKLAAQDLIGMKDFSAFANEKKTHPICRIKQIEISSLGAHRLQIAMVGDRFLYKMARTLAGTLLYIGCEKLPFDAIPSILASKQRKTAGMTAPAHGLFIHRVFYE